VSIPNDPAANGSAPEARNLDLPLMDERDSELWAEADENRDRSVWPALSESLSDPGRRLLFEALRDAVEATPGDPERALMVVEAFWRTMQIRRGSGYEARMAAARPARAYGPTELRREIESRVSSA
jgi:hypothetical protein